MLIASVLLDAAARPRAPGLRRGPGLALHALAMTALFGFGLAMSGNVAVAALLSTAMMAVFALASNAKNRMLGEPLVFSDLALLIGVVRHPQFYFTALSRRQRGLLAIGALLALAVFIALFTPSLAPHLAGVALLLGAAGTIALLLRSRRYDAVAPTPDLAGDVARYGLVATLLLYWMRWRHSADPQPLARLVAGDPPALIVVIQCESFADPVEITGDASAALPALEAARAAAWQYGELDVSGFGAYTMRTEYGVLFGRSEHELGFRRYDPFLSALGETSHALSARLGGAGYRSTFVHPHDLRFYRRDRLMPAIGFDTVIGDEGFAPLPPGAGRYVDDRTLGAALAGLIDQAAAPTMIYAVTMENHGPWDSAGVAQAPLDAYLGHLQSSDAMLGHLVARLSRDGRPALLVFFGDHRPSIPGVTEPSGARHTPYVMLRFAPGGQVIDGPGRVDLTPAALHHAILDAVTDDALNRAA